ncbi:uncharacterized protein LOC109852211 [Pseudomyrmex gracilis]|uniref:uncharacterized protein LOC109852211 n=1 Tax=Pseudomyrmex gracilis TaxID=219809 RepID=UPI000994F872|nr:uncharacterized protein LOC109852211 [Pseudomyrmex gracilis]
MSTSLVYKSLELSGFEKDSHKAQKRKKKRKNIKYEGVWDLIPPKHRIFSKNDETDPDIPLGRSSKITVYETQKHLASQEDPTEKNVQLLLSLCNNRLDPKTTSTLLHRAVGRRYARQQEKPKESEATAFTEEDFRKFEQEYTE